MRWFLAVFALGCAPDRGEAPTPCSTPVEDWLWVDAEWSSDCSRWDAATGDHLCLFLTLNECHDCMSGLDFPREPITAVRGATLSSLGEEYGQLTVDLLGASVSVPVELEVTILCDAGTRGTFRVHSDMSNAAPRFAWDLSR